MGRTAEDKSWGAYYRRLRVESGEQAWLDLGLSKRAARCLVILGCKTPEDIRHCGRSKFIGMSNFGQKTIEEIGRVIGEDWGSAQGLGKLRTETLISELAKRGYTVTPRD